MMVASDKEATHLPFCSRKYDGGVRLSNCVSVLLIFVFWYSMIDCQSFAFAVFSSSNVPIIVALSTFAPVSVVIIKDNWVSRDCACVISNR